MAGVLEVKEDTHERVVEQAEQLLVVHREQAQLLEGLRQVGRGLARHRQTLGLRGKLAEVFQRRRVPQQRELHPVRPLEAHDGVPHPERHR